MKSLPPPPPVKKAESAIQESSSSDSITENDMPVKQKFSFDDEEYMLAVEAGDMDAAQQMVDEAAQAAGYTVKAIHGTAKDFVEFGNKGTKTEAKSAALAFWFSDSESTARAYSTPQATDVSEESWDAISREADKRIKEFEKEAFWTDYSGVSGELKFREDVVEQYFAEYLPVEHDEIIKEGYNFGFDGILKWYNKHFEKGRMHPAKLKEKLTQLMDAGIIRSIANEGEYGAKPRVMNVFLRGNLLQSADIRGTDQEKVERPECADGGDGTRGGNQKE